MASRSFHQRICLQVFHEDECMDSPVGFAAEDVANYLAWRDGPSLTVAQAREAIEFLSSDDRIVAMDNDERYRAI